MKIDRRFVEQIEESDRSRSLVESMSRMVHSLGLTAVAEGVETLEQAQTLRAMGFELAQGFYFARPIAADELIDAIANIPSVTGDWVAVERLTGTGAGRVGASRTRGVDEPDRADRRRAPVRIASTDV